MSGAALFDLDKTLISCNCSFEFGRFLYNKGLLPFKSMCALVLVYYLHTIFGLPVRELHEASFRILFKGKEKRAVELLADEFIRTKFPTFVRESVAGRLKAAKARGEKVMIFSNSPDFLVERASRYFGVAEFVATEYETDIDGRFYSVAKIVDGEAKLKAASHFTQSATAAYSDSILDIKLLEWVHTAVAVCPDRKLKKVAFQKGWEVIWE